MTTVPKPNVHLKLHSYQPKKDEILEDISIDATPEELAAAVLRPVNLIREPVKKPG